MEVADELKALREEVAALRKEIGELRATTPRIYIQGAPQAPAPGFPQPLPMPPYPFQPYYVPNTCEPQWKTAWEVTCAADPTPGPTVGGYAPVAGGLAPRAA